MRFDHVGQAVKDCANLPAAEPGAGGDLIKDLSLGETVFDGCGFGGHARDFKEPGRRCQDMLT